VSRVAVVTGGSRGIGREVALRLARDGCAVVVGFADRAAAAQEVVEEITDTGGRAVAVGGDIGKPAIAVTLMDTAEATFGGVDVVVNVAGISQPALAPVRELDFDVLERVHAVNVRGTFAVVREAARRVRAGGAIVTFSSAVVGLSNPGSAVYVSSKAAVEALTLIVARELRGRDVTINCVAPGPTATELFLSGKDDAAIERAAKQAPLERIAAPEEIADVVAFLVGPARWINGQVVRANGGLV
jgi:3-oxoacyl-[acyl-carrier protein] reductase